MFAGLKYNTYLEFCFDLGQRMEFFVQLILIGIYPILESNPLIQTETVVSTPP